MSIRKREHKKAKGGIVYETYFLYKENGETKRYSKSGFATKKEAKEHEALIQAELKQTGRLRVETKKTLNEVMNEFLEVGSSGYQHNTIVSTKATFHYFKDNIGKLPIISIDYKTLQAYFNSRENEGIEANKNIRKALNRAFVYAIKCDYIKTNPLQYVTLKGQEKRLKKDILTYEEFELLVDELESYNTFDYKAYAMALRIGYYTGLRRSELFALEKSDVDLEHMEISITKKLNCDGLKRSEYFVDTQLKNNASKGNVVIPDALKDSLAEWLKINPYEKLICNEKGEYFNVDGISQQIKKVAKKFNIDFHMHMLRHSYCSALVNSGVDVKTAQELMRHSNVKTTLQFYTHITDTHKKQAVNDVFNTNCVENVSSLKNKNRAYS